MTKSLSYRIHSVSAWLGFRLFQLLPLPVGSAIGAGLGHLYAVYGDARGQLWFKRVKRNLIAVTGDDDPKRTSQRAYQTLRNSGRVTAEFPAIDARRHKHRLNIIGGHHVDQLEGPTIIVSAHLGNWETSAASLVLRGKPITGIYVPPENETVHQLAMEARNRLLRDTPGCRLLAVTDDTAIKKVLRAAWQKENLQIFVDEEKDGLIWSPPLGRKLPDQGNRMLAALLALKCDYQLLPVHVRRKKGAWLDLIVEPPMEITKTGDHNADMKRIGNQIAEMTERWVKETPEQWYWMPNLRLDRPFPEQATSKSG